jgi:type IV pilus assembly protein PilQ
MRATAFILVLGVAISAQMSGAASGPAAGTVLGTRLKAISAHVNAKGASIVIEATDPVPYIATRPDPFTVLIDFRNASADAVANSVASNSKSPIAAVSVEPVDPSEEPGSRVHITLAQPLAHRVRSDRNAVIVDFDATHLVAAPRVPHPSDGPLHAGAPPTLRTLADPMAVDPIAALGLAKPSNAGAVFTPSAKQPSAFQQAPATQTTAPATPQGERLAQSTRETRFSGHPVSLDFQGADLRAVLRTFAEISGLNIVIDPAVMGSVDVALRDVPWDQALDIILRANKLGYTVDGTIVRIAPLITLADEEGQRRKLSEEQALSGDLRVFTKTLSYAKADELQALLTKSTLSQRGTVQVDPRTNTLIITDLQERLGQASDLITTLDRPQPQVEIEARIVQTNKNYARQLGIQWGFVGRVDPALGNTTNLAFPNSGTIAGAANGGPIGTAINLPTTGAATSGIALALGSVNGSFNLDVALSALETSGNGRILSTPRVTTQNNIAAEMTQGTQIPIQVVANNTVTVTFKDAALSLKVTPQITAAGTVIMAIALENSQADFTRAVNGVPPINTQRANTSVLVTDGQTTVIGGVFVSNEQYETDRTPGLGQVPLLKWLFKRDISNSTNQELLIFITPRIIRG